MADSKTPPLRPLRLRLATAARVVGKPQFVLEKDYALSHLLAGIATVPALRDWLVFKGGTCLRKVYFPGYRSSEDLDYTTHSPWSCVSLPGALQEAGHAMKAQLLAYGPFEIIASEERHRDQHPRGQCVFRVRVQFPWVRNPDCNLKVEVSAQEPLLVGPVDRHLIHDFPGESLNVTVAAHRLEEIAAEKLRAFLQSRQHLRDRERLRNRLRALYDLWSLHQQRDLPVDWHEVRKLLPAKADMYGIAYSRPEDLRDERVLQGIQRDWYAQLASFVIDLPPFEQALAAVHSLLYKSLR